MKKQYLMPSVEAIDTMCGPVMIEAGSNAPAGAVGDAPARSIIPGFSTVAVEK